MTVWSEIVLMTGAGMLIALPLSLLPGLHIFNLMAVLLWLVTVGTLSPAVSAVGVHAFTAAMVTSYAVIGIIPAVYLAAPDDASLFTVRPGQKYVQRGVGYHAVMLVAIGSMSGLLILLPLIALVPPAAVPGLLSLLRPHTHWILWCLILLMLMSEWPRSHSGWAPGWRWFWIANRSCFAGYLTFLLAGLLGCLVMIGHPLKAEHSLHGLMPVFIGLFTIPQLLLNMLDRVSVPAQAFTPVQVPWRLAGHGVLAGSLGGLAAVLLPGVTGGVGGWLAGHVTALRDDRAYLISQGASRTHYYTGGLLLFALPPLHTARGGAAMMTQTIIQADSTRGLAATCAAIALAAVIAIWLLRPAARFVSSLLRTFGQRRIAAFSLVISLLLVVGLTGVMGVVLMTVATAIGLIPILYQSRRLNCLGVILLPLAIILSGADGAIGSLLGLL